MSSLTRGREDSPQLYGNRLSTESPSSAVPPSSTEQLHQKNNGEEEEYPGTIPCEVCGKNIPIPDFVEHEVIILLVCCMYNTVCTVLLCMLCTCVCVCVCVCVSVCMCVSMCVHVCICVYVRLYVRTCVVCMGRGFWTCGIFST